MRIKVGLFRHVSDHALKAGEIVINAATSVKNLTFGRFDQACEHLDSCALAGAIRSEITEDFARPDRKADSVNRRYVAVMLGEIAGFEHGLLPRCIRHRDVRICSAEILQSRDSFVHEQEIERHANQQQSVHCEYDGSCEQRHYPAGHKIAEWHTAAKGAVVDTHHASAHFISCDELHQ